MPATHHKISMNSDQTTTQSKFMAVFMVLIYGVCEPKKQDGLEGVHLADGHTNKTGVKPDIPTKSYICMSTSWLLGNVYMAKSCKGEKRVPDSLKLELVS